jgi:hypothetical protein
LLGSLSRELQQGRTSRSRPSVGDSRGGCHPEGRIAGSSPGRFVDHLPKKFRPTSRPTRAFRSPVRTTTGAPTPTSAFVNECVDSPLARAVECGRQRPLARLRSPRVTTCSTRRTHTESRWTKAAMTFRCRSTARHQHRRLDLFVVEHVFPAEARCRNYRVAVHPDDQVIPPVAKDSRAARWHPALDHAAHDNQAAHVPVSQTSRAYRGSPAMSSTVRSGRTGPLA